MHKELVWLYGIWLLYFHSTRQDPQCNIQVGAEIIHCISQGLMLMSGFLGFLGV